MKYLSKEQVAANRAKLVNSALGKPAHVTDREAEVIANAERYRVHVFDGRLPHGHFETTLNTPSEVHRFYSQLIPEAQRKCLIYAVWGTRDALVPQSRYGEFILMPANGHGQKKRA